MKILVTVPNIGWNRREVTKYLLWLKSNFNHKLTFEFPNHRPLENNQHHIIGDILKGDYDFWFNIDADGPPSGNPLQIASLDKDVIGFPAPVWYVDPAKPNDRPWYWNAYDYIESEEGYKEHLPQKGLQRVDAIGGHCFLIARRVFMNPDMQRGAFTRILYNDGRVKHSNDLSFCQRATKKGYEIYAHYDYPCQHFVEIELTEMIQRVNHLLSNNQLLKTTSTKWHYNG